MKLLSTGSAIIVGVLLVLVTDEPAPGAAARDYAAVVSQWAQTLAVEEAAVEQIARYSQEEDDMGDAYPAALAANVRRLLIEDAARALATLPTYKGEPMVEAEFLEAGFADPSGEKPEENHQRKFEEGFIRIESRAFIAADRVTPQQALELFSSPQFRMDCSSRIERIWPEDGLSCVEVGGVKAIMSPTMACSRVDGMDDPEVASQHSQSVSNPGDDDYQTVYFKESLKTFIAVDGGLVYHYIHYTRSVKLGSIKRTFGRGKIEDSEMSKILELQRRLSDGD
jgi:hypothetical protein